MDNINDPTPFLLSETERTSPLWRKLEEHLKEKLEQYRAKNDGPLDPITTATVRGHIQSLRSLLALGKDE